MVDHLMILASSPVLSSTFAEERDPVSAFPILIPLPLQEGERLGEGVFNG